MARNSIPFSEEEDAILKRLYGKAPVRTIIMSEIWGRSEPQITSRAKELGLRNQMRYRNHWTVEDMEYLADNYESAEWGVMVDTLHRPGSAIRNKASLMGLKRGKK